MHLYCCVKYIEWKKLSDRKHRKFLTFDTNKLAANFEQTTIHYFNLQVGYIKTKRAWYMIEPVAGHDFTKEIEQPHIVYKRSPDDFQTTAMQNLCDVINNTSRIIAKRALNSQKKALTESNEFKSYTLELLVVLDKSLLDYYRKISFDVENYILTLFNMASWKLSKSVTNSFLIEILKYLFFSGCRVVSWCQFRCTHAIDYSENYKIRSGRKWGKVINRSFLCVE